ncbi:hypothetical protein DSL72_008895 [Monilinia vaccinii-corymbosi]|uniref:Uncharacterized protein n=1 Tax=Monilinia vaccinii-corymbosi TaxID=61207 RepID=A0A8A3PSS2_9HELO|nr:hypothetical protein DSL72_008895 [Monilinia vaccinii-corymbosi]
MSFPRQKPRFSQAGKFTGKNESASRWLRRIRLDLASRNSGSLPTHMYVWAIGVLLDGPAAHWCGSVPEVKHILENYDTASSADVRWLEHELIKKFPGEIIDNPVGRIAIHDHSYSLDVSADSDATAMMLAGLYIGDRTKRWNQMSGRTQDQNHRNHRREAPQKNIQGNIVKEYQFHNKPRVPPSSSKYYNDQYNGSTTAAKTLSASKTHSSARSQIPTTPRSILKNSNSTSSNPPPSVNSFKKEERVKDHYSRAGSSPFFPGNQLPNKSQKSQIPQPRTSPHDLHTKYSPRAPDLRRMYQSPKATYREVITEPSKPQRRYWSYVPLPVTHFTPYLGQKSTQHRDSPLPHYKRPENNSDAWKTSNSAMATLEERRRAAKSLSRTPVRQEETNYHYPTRNPKWG